MNEFSTSQDAVEHVIFGSTSGFDRILFPFVMEIQADFGINANPKVVVHHALFIHFIPEEKCIENATCCIHFAARISTYGGGVQSMMGVTGAHRASAEAKTTIETRPRSADRSRSVYRTFKVHEFNNIERAHNV